MNQLHYVIQDYTEHDFSSVWKTTKPIHEDNLEYLAQDIAEDHYNDDPSDPNEFECVVGVKWNEQIKWFNITAQISYDFYSDEIDCPIKGEI
jgi:hypothetical protein